MLSLNMMAEEEEATGPSVDSEDMEERILARRLRIQKRVEIQKRQQEGIEDEVAPVELSKSRKQIEISRQRITKLNRDGNELITNIRVAGDARENMRRIEEEEIRRQTRERMESEARTALERFDEITKKWELSLQKEIPQELNEMLQQQKEACNTMIDEKNKLINDLQLELKAKDDLYVKELKKQAEDIDLLIERMDEQVRTMTKTYREELVQIEKAFISQRDDLMESQNSQWEQMMQVIREKQNEYLKGRQLRVDDYENSLQDLRVKHAEEYNSLKITLECEVQELERQLQLVKANYQLNLEKLEYNFQVLKKRDEEHSITKSQQKRRITRLQDVLNNLKIKLAKQEKQFRADNEQLTEDFKRVTEQFRDLQKKSKNLLGADSKKFRDIWLMNEEELKILSHRLLDADKIITEQQLGLSYHGPDISFMENVGPLKNAGVEQIETKHSLSSAMFVVQEILSKAHSGDSEPNFDAIKEEGMTVNTLGATVVKSILEMLCNESTFLIESKLQKLLQPLDKDEQFLMRLDAVFSALGVSTELDVNHLITFFIRSIGNKMIHVYSDHPELRMAQSESNTKSSSTQDFSVSNSEESDETSDSKGEDKAGEEPAAESSEMVTESTQEETEESKDDTAADESWVMDEKTKMSQQETEESESSPSIMLIHPTDVNKAVKLFVHDFYKADRERMKRILSAKFTLAGLEERDDTEDQAYWLTYQTNLIDSDKEKMWDALIESLDQYYSLLTGRSSAITEVDALRVQNAELRHLLQQYVGSKVNYELEVPPTRLMQMDRLQ